MIPNHSSFLAAVQERRKVCVHFFSKADNGTLDRVCAPMNYGPDGSVADGLHRYWLWDFAGVVGARTLRLLPQEIVDLQVLGEVFDPVSFAGDEVAVSAPVPGNAPCVPLEPPLPVGSSGAQP